MANSPSLAAPARNLTAATACGEAHRSGMSSGKAHSVTVTTQLPPRRPCGRMSQTLSAAWPSAAFREEGSPWLLPAWSDHRQHPPTVAATPRLLHLASSPYMRPSGDVWRLSSTSTSRPDARPQRWSSRDTNATVPPPEPDHFSPHVVRVPARADVDRQYSRCNRLLAGLSAQAGKVTM